jgi:hypothetical protein
LSDGSLFMPDIDRERGVSSELPNERLGVSKQNQRGVNGAKPTLITFDEVAKVPQYVKNMIAPIAYERRAGVCLRYRGRSIVIMATNLAVEGLGDSLQAHLRNRLIVVKMRKADWRRVDQRLRSAQQAERYADRLRERAQLCVRLIP